MIGDRMDTDVVAGIEAGLDTILVLTGSTSEADIEKYPFRPGRVLPSIADVIELVICQSARRPKVRRETSGAFTARPTSARNSVYSGERRSSSGSTPVRGRSTGRSSAT